MVGERPLSATLRQLGATVIKTPTLSTLPRTLGPVRLGRYALGVRTVVRTIRDLVERHDIEVVHGVHETMWGVLLGLWRVPVGRVVSVHGLRFASPAWAGRLNTRLLAASAERIICVSETVRAVFRRWNVPDVQLALVPSSVDLDRFRPEISGAAIRREFAIPPGAPVIGTVGSVDERKGQIHLVEACRLIRGRHPALRCLIVGYTNEGPAAQVEYLRLLRARATALGLDGSVTFVPAREDVPEVIAALDILVQPSLTEAGPRAPLEAMAMARPVVGTRVGGTAEEIVDGETGVLVPPGVAGPLAEAISGLLDAPDERRRLGQAGRVRVEQRYSLAATADLIERIYREAASVARRLEAR
jgi:glycosyltransferase involved in cell wall biosynthesis